MSILVVFPHITEPTKTNGGVNNQETLRDMTLDCLIQNSEMNPTLTARSSRSQLNDYQGANLLIAFPLQFPYGFGQREIDQIGVEKKMSEDSKTGGLLSVAPTTELYGQKQRLEVQVKQSIC